MVYDIRPGAGNPRNSEGDTILLRDGRLLLAWSRFTGPEDHAQADIAAISTSNWGDTWTEPRTLVSRAEAAQNVMSVSLLRERGTGHVLLFYLRKNGPSDLQVRLMRSRDEGATWSSPQQVSNRQGYNVMNNARVIQLSGGRLLAPVAWTRDWTVCRQQVAFCYLSDDSGATWRMGHGAVAIPASAVGCQEPGLVETDADGQVLMIIRTDQGYVCAARSSDGGETWDEPQPMRDLPAPVAPATIARLPDGALLIVYNHRPEGASAGWGDRTPLAAARSADQGLSWRRLADIEPSPHHAYAYTSLRLYEQRVVLTYYVWPRSVQTGFDQTTLRFRVMPLGALLT